MITISLMEMKGNNTNIKENTIDWVHVWIENENVIIIMLL